MSQETRIKLACTVCQHGNYDSHKNKKIKGRLEISKYCKMCRKHVSHKETK